LTSGIETKKHIYIMKKKTMWQQFQNKISKSYKEAKSISIAHKYMTGHFPALVQVLQ
jgi:hypothetical protein